jgi:predicted ATPase
LCLKRSYALLIVITARPEFKPPWTPHPEARQMPPPKFTPGESRSLLAGIVGDKSLPAELAAQIIERTDGVPLYVEELTKTILETAELIVEGDRLAYAGSSAAVFIPETLRGSLMARLDRVHGKRGGPSGLGGRS